MLYVFQSGTKKGQLAPIILKNIIDAHKANIRELVESESRHPKEHAKLYDKYTHLISKQADKDIDKFLREEHSFDDYAREVRKYNKLGEEIQYKSRKVVRLGMFEVHCDELIRALTKRAESIANKLLTRMQADHSKESDK